MPRKALELPMMHHKWLFRGLEYWVWTSQKKKIYVRNEVIHSRNDELRSSAPRARDGDTRSGDGLSLRAAGKWGTGPAGACGYDATTIEILLIPVLFSPTFHTSSPDVDQHCSPAST
jgi:hypothetical protein